jgi:hypothetical protein
LTGRADSGEVVALSRHGAFTALMLTGLLLLPACSAGNPGSRDLVRVGGVVHIGPFTQLFASPLPADQARAAVVEGFREGMVLWDRSENGRRLVPPVREYVTGQALRQLRAAMKARQARDLVLAGADRFFLTRVTAIAGRRATLTTCDDGSKFKEEDPRTGKVDVHFVPTPGQAYVYETWWMVRLGGHWAITALSAATLPSHRAEPCQPGMTGSGPSRRPDVAGLLPHMSAALRTARSVHISGTIRQGGKTLGLNLGLTRSGGLSGQIYENGTAFTVLATHGHIYLKLSAAFLKLVHLPASACSLYCGKYLEYPAAISRGQLTRLNLSSVTHSLTRTPASKVKFLGAVTTRGQLAWLLAGSTRKLDLRRSARQAVCPPRRRTAAGPGQREPDPVERSADPRAPAPESGRATPPAQADDRPPAGKDNH